MTVSNLNSAESTLGWFESGEGQDIAAFLFGYFQKYIRSEDLPSNFHIINMSGIRGVAYDPTDADSAHDWNKFAFALSEKHKRTGYILKNEKQFEKNNALYHRYYLKPSTKLQLERPAEQLYGNICIELIFNDNALKRFKCQSTYYEDMNFKKVRSFDQWIGVIFNNETFDL